MSQNRTLHIDIIRDRHAKPLAIVKNFPGLDAEMYPDSLDKIIALQERERGITPLPLEPELLLNRVAQGGHSGQFLADAFLSAYRTDRPFQYSLGELIRLDAEGFRLFHEILHIRHVTGWSDDGLYQIEQQIKKNARHE